MESFRGIRRLGYNLSSAGHALCDSLLLTFYVPFLLPAKEKVQEGMVQFISDKLILGFLTVLGLLMVLGRVIDGVADPLIASWSDRSRSSLGRRRAFMIFGGFPLVLSAVLIYFPPVGETSWINSVFLGVVFSSFFFFYTMYVAPYLALIPELGHSEMERVGLTTVQGYFTMAGGAIVMMGGPFLLGIFLKGSDPVAAYRKMAVILGIIGLVLLYVAVFAVDEKKYTNAKPSKVPLFKSFRMTLRNRPFIIFLIANMCFWYVFNTIRSSALPIGVRLMRVDEAAAGLNFTLLFALAAPCFLLVWYLSRRIGKKILMILGLGSFSIVCILFSLIGVVPVNPQIWGLVVFGLAGFPAAVLLVIPNVFIAELSDYDFKKTSERREAMYFGVHGFFMKMNLGLSAAVLAFLYSAFGKDIANPLGVRLTCVVASVVALIGLVVMSRYPEKEVAEQKG